MSATQGQLRHVLHPFTDKPTGVTFLKGLDNMCTREELNSAGFYNVPASYGVDRERSLIWCCYVATTLIRTGEEFGLICFASYLCE